jgi:hypothetical protein
VFCEVKVFKKLILPENVVFLCVLALAIRANILKTVSSSTLTPKE